MLLNKIRNKKLIKNLTDIPPNTNSDGDLIERKLVKAKDENMYIILHIQLCDEEGTLSTLGKYEIQNNKYHKIGELKYVYIEDNQPPYMQLCDIIFDKKYRNNGLGSMILELFETRAKSYGAKYITGNLSSVDEENPADEEFRNSFYLKRGYEIINSEKIYKEL